jgi:hypothetical protein
LVLVSLDHPILQNPFIFVSTFTKKNIKKIISIKFY